jgi:hypothetical protein
MSILGHFGVVLFALTVASAPAQARRVAVDDGQPVLDLGYCVLGASESTIPCNGQALGFKLRLATGTFETAFVYDDGLVSIGRKVSESYSDYSGYTPFADYYAAAADGTLLLAPSLSPARSNFEIRYSNIIASPPGTFTVEWSEYSTRNNTGRGYDLCLGCAKNTLTIVSNPDGGATVTYRWENDMIFNDFNYYNNGHQMFGSSVAGQPDLQLLYTVEDRFGLPTPIPVPTYSFTILGVGAVPEPATWAMMIAGFGLVGASMRRRERRTA